ncbi:hypothetical protein PAXRUDRAFT_827545 [Paxillus rubicundulus Ve08.2h10]|uniref:Unplaced genomic scaffold scaffold_255, whole genome shotgun sequence n=1 Tax=Paxillus rubicundulus Ve08.2h10 TaxID=930991 RepID=A0A0D0DQQ7_9AGAM|nr:hypothetical protein PAXRUDRAFT_827545 [Paxillus rubicundulus Ve08.2h10]
MPTRRTQPSGRGIGTVGNTPDPLDHILTTASQNVRDTPGRRTRLACSSVDMLWVMSYAPGEGKCGNSILVNFACKADMAVGIHIRLVIGRRAVSTQVRELEPPGCGRWQLEGCIPSFSKQKSSSAMVPLTIQAVSNANRVLDSVTFGDFTYSDIDCLEEISRRSSHTPSSSPTDNTHSSSIFSAVSGTDNSDRFSKRHSPYNHPHTPPSSDSEYAPSQSSQSRKGITRSQSQLLAQGLRRTARPSFPEFSEENTQTAILEMTTPLDSFCHDWDESELQAGRRLVRFRRMQDRNKLIVSAEPISQAEYDGNDIVISCIYRDETDSCCVTSVDIIMLLERLVEADFEVDEKNRIRRNLEGLRPTTVSKSRPECESFFQRIMDFPDPKPRKIEKDVKVFDWKNLPQALEKIVSKYSLWVSPTLPKVEAPPLSVVTTFSQGTTTVGPSQDDHPDYATSYGDNSAHPSACHDYGNSAHPSACHDTHTEASQLSHLSPVQLAEFPLETSSDPVPENHLYTLQEENLQPVYVDPETMQRYYRGADAVYGTSPSLQRHMYTAELPPVGDASSHSFVGDRVSADWVTQPLDEAMLVSGLPVQEPSYVPTYDFTQSDSQESIDIYSAPQYAMNTYDSFEFQTLREHNMNAALASQVA